MSFDNKFTGRIFQVIEALDYGDAVSTQAMELETLLKQMGFDTTIYSKWHHPEVEAFRLSLDDLAATDQDVVILHYAGFSEYALAAVRQLRSTRICVYHNITPHAFFQAGTPLYDFCLKGRQQLKELVREFHYFWGDSNYNLQELVELGVDTRSCAVVPIAVNRVRVVQYDDAQRESGAWMFMAASRQTRAKLTL